MFKSLVEVPNALCPFGLFISPFFTDTGPVRLKVLTAVDSFRTSVATPLEQIMYISAFIMACQATNLRCKQRFRVEGGGFEDLLLLNLDRL